MSVWSPVDLLSSTARPVPSATSSDRRPGSSGSDARDVMDQLRVGEQRNGDPVNGSAGPPAAHSGPSSLPPAFGSKNKRHTPLDAGLNSKRPRVRDYSGSRGSQSTRPLFADLPARPFPLPLVKTPHNCDNVPKDQPELHAAASRPSADSEFGAPLDLCIKKPAAPSRTSSDDQNCRMSESSSHSDERSTPSAAVPPVFPKKRGRKPKSLLMAGLSAAPSSSSSAMPVPANENRPRKRGRPPLMSPPPNIGMDVSSAKAMGRGAEDLAMISNRLQASVFAQQQLAAQAGWQSLFPGAGGHQLLLQHSLRDAIAQLSSLHSFPSSSSTITPQPQSGRAASDTHSRNSHPSARDQDSDADSEHDSRDDFRPDLNEEDIRMPLKCGWRRYTIISRISSGGVRGDVLYMTPEGKKLRNLNDIQRYLNKNNTRKLTRDNFSFSCKWFVGEFNQPSQDKQEHQMLSESEVINRIEELKRMKRKKMSGKTSAKRGRKPRESSDAGPSGSTADQRKLEEDILMTQAQMLQLSANFRMDEMKLLDVIQAIQKNNQNQEQELAKEEEMRKLQAKAKVREIEIKRQQEEQLQKEQELQKRREMQMMAEIERERRRQHMLMVRSMDLHKRLEERERKREEVMQEKRAAQEKKMQKKRLETELVKELRKPVDDMRLRDVKALPTLNRIPGLKLPARAFSEILLVNEFLHNFGETLGYDMDSLPSLNSFQLALLNMDEGSEEELLSVLQHLLVCVIEDPGLPVNISTGVGQKLKDAPITNYNMSEILRLYFQSIVLHRESAAKSQEGRIYRTLSRNKPFLSLPPTLKAEILAYLCNELLCNQAIVKQIDDSIENVASIRKDKWVVDCELRKFRGIQSARVRKAEDATETDIATQNSEEKLVEDDDHAEKREVLDEESGDSGAENEENGAANDQDEEPEMSNDEVEKRIEKLSRQCTLMTNKLTKAVHGLRVSCLGQDRYRRRYWVLPAAGGVFVEGLESAEPEELENNADGLPAEIDLPVAVPVQAEENGSGEHSVSDDSGEAGEAAVKIEPQANQNEKCRKSDAQEGSAGADECEAVRENGDCKEVCTKTDALGISPLVASALFGGQEPAENGVRHSISLLNPENSCKSETTGHWFSILPRQPCCATIVTCSENSDSGPIPARDVEMQSEPSAPLVNGTSSKTFAPEMDDMEESPKKSFDVLNHLANGGSLDVKLLAAIEELGDICPSLQKKLAAQREEQFDQAQNIPPEFQFGWWRVTDPSQIRALIDVLHERGVRERFLHKHMTKYLSYVVSKCKSNAAEFDVTELDRKIYEECSFGAPRDSGRYCRDVALRFDIAVIEEIETLEEKISNSSMQVRGWKPTLKIGANPDLRFKRRLADWSPAADGVRNVAEEILCASGSDSSDSSDDEENERSENVVDTLSFGKERLLSTEAMIERRYLKPPLGFKANTVLVSSGSTDELAENAADENAPSGLVRWREAVRECTTSAQLALLLHFLESCIAWDKSIMRASCQFCHSGENEAQLLLCDGCDKGYHMYCFKPKMEIVPDGDWFCFECQNKNTIDKVCIVCGKKGKLLSCETCPKVFHPNCIDPPVSKLPKGKWSCQICIRKPKKVSKTMARKSTSFLEEKAAVREANKELTITPVNTPKESKKTSASQSSAAKSRKDSKAEKEAAEKEVRTVPESRSSAKKDRKSKENADVTGLTACSVILSEMELHEDAWPFKTPVNTKQFPTYKKIIKKPIDLQSMRHKLECGVYKNKMDWNSDVILMFDNCETFNEDESPVGRAGHSLRSFFDKRWADLFDKSAC